MSIRLKYTAPVSPICLQKGFPMMSRSLRSLLVLGISLNFACHTSHRTQPLAPVTSPEPAPSDETKPDHPLFITQVSSEVLEQLKAQGCSVSNDKGVESCQVPETFGPADSLFVQLHG